MALKQGRVTVTTSPTALDLVTADRRGTPIIRNRDATVAVYLGNRDVTSSDGWQLDPGEWIAPDLRDYDGGIYGVTASGSAVCHVLQVAG